MRYIQTDEPGEDDFTQRVGGLVESAKRNTQWRQQFMEWDREMAYMRAKGREEKAVEDARSFYANGASLELIAKSLNMTEEQVKEIVFETAQAAN